jgi:DNA invertase Pin-like site-specific DNA recombinase
LANQVALYTRVSTDRQTTENQERELRAIAARAGWHVVEVYRDEGISGAKGRDERPAFDALCKDAARRQFDMVMAWSVDRLGRSLQDLIGFLSEQLPRRSALKQPQFPSMVTALRVGSVLCCWC